MNACDLDPDCHDQGCGERPDSCQRVRDMRAGIDRRKDAAWAAVFRSLDALDTRPARGVVVESETRKTAMTDRSDDIYREAANLSRCTADVVERSILARRVGRHWALDARYGSGAAPYYEGGDHPLDRLTDRLWRATIKTACFVGKFLTAAAIGIILGRLFT